MRWLGAALAAASLVAHAHDEKPRPAAPAAAASHLAVIRSAPDFSLQDVSGKDVRLSALRGKPVLVAFIYTGCTSACPLVSFRMAQLQRKLAEAGLPAALVSVSVDPERDDAKTLSDYAARLGARPGWHFVQADAGVLSAYEEWTTRLPSGDIDHPARLHLVDALGRVREIYSLAFFDEHQAFADIKALR